MLNIYKLKLTNLQQSIFRLLSVNAGTSLNQRQIANLIGVSQPAVIKSLPFLEKQGIIEMSQDKETRRWAISLNRHESRILQLKRADNLRLIYETGFSDFLEEEFAGGTIILFGSYSRGEDIIGSDIDIAVVGRKEKNIGLGKFEKMLRRKININFYDSTKNIHKNLMENICNGIVLVGGIEL